MINNFEKELQPQTTEKRTIILISPAKKCTFSSENFTIIQKFITWIENCAHYSEKSGNVYHFPKDNYVIISDIKWKKLNSVNVS